MRQYHRFLRIVLCIIVHIFFITIPDFPQAAGAETGMAGGGAAATGQADNVGYSAKLYNADNGLPTSEANVVLSASDGFIWVGGYSGLIRYDGTSFERQDSSSGITSVNTLFEDSKKRLWVGTNDNGVVCLYKGHSEHYSHHNGLNSTSVTAITEDPNGNIIIGTKLGIYYFDTDMNIGIIGDSQVKSSYIVQLKNDSAGAICGVTKNNAVFRIKDLRMTDYYNGTEIGVADACSVLPCADQPGKVWLGTNSGFICCGSFQDGFNKLEKHYLFCEEQSDIPGAKNVTFKLTTEPVNQLTYAANRIWATTNSKVFYGDYKGNFTQLDHIPLNGGIENIAEDFEGNIWVSSSRQGIMKIAANKFFDLTARAGLEQKIVNTTCMHDDVLYIGTDSGLQAVGKNLTPQTNYLTKFIGDARIRNLFEDADGNLWISTFNHDLGLICYMADSSITSFTEKNGLPNNKVRCTVQAPDGAVLASTNGGTAVIRNGKIERVLDGSKGLNNTVILTAETTADGKYYLGSDGDGIYVVDGSKLTHLSLEDGLTSDVILRIKNDEERGVIWVITSNSIQYIKDGVIKPVSGFPYTNNYDIYFNKSGDAWVLASNGIYVANAQDMLEKDHFNYTFYNVSNGLSSAPTANSFSYLDANGDLYISGRSSVSRVNIDSYFAQEQDIKFNVLYIEDGKNRYYPDADKTFTLPSSAKNITIYGYALTYSMHDPQVQYWLEGADHEPITTNKSAMAPVRYTNLSGGTYTFNLALIDGSTHTVRQTETFSIIKKRAFFEEFWFYFFCAVFAMFGIAWTFLFSLRRKTEKIRKQEEEQRKLQRLFEQTATALVSAIDAKDRYTHGHSARVAEYSRKLAEMSGKSEKECNEIYYAGLLHDVGKIGIPSKIINKEGRLTDEEFALIKQHPAMGAQILKSITEYPYLSIGALSHHERYDGRGYPLALKGTDIPEIARIVSVADAYDAMTSKRSYRDPIPQQKVREEFVKGSGTQFDPQYAKLMLQIIDLDTDYQLKEGAEIRELAGKNELLIHNHRSNVSDGILLTSFATTISMKITPAEENLPPIPSLLLFDSLDGHVHTEEREVRDLLYFEYGEIWFNGRTVETGARKMQVRVSPNSSAAASQTDEYTIEAIKQKDHILIRIIGNRQTVEIITALPDSTRYAYIGLTGAHCRISDVSIEKSDEAVPEGYIPRIAEEISYINVPAGDIPNVQIDGYRTAATQGIEIKDSMEITLHTMSLPTARLVWHCPFITLFTSDDKQVDGQNYRELTFVRFDGECWECDSACTIKTTTTKGANFENWDVWKKQNKEGYDSTVTFQRTNAEIIIRTQNAGISVTVTANVQNVKKPIYAAITGDQCALTNIHIK